MAVSRIKEWAAGEVLSASDLNDEFDNLNQTGVAFPLTENVSCAGYTVSNAVLGTLKQLNDNVVCIDNYADFATAISSIGSTVTTLIINKNTNVTANATVPSTLTLWFMGQGKLTVSVATTTTINGPVIAEPRQIFAGSGTVAGFSMCPYILPNWWTTNTTPGTTGMGSAIQSAVTALAGGTGGTILFLPHSYKVDSLITSIGAAIHFVGMGNSLLVKAVAGDLFTITGAYNKFINVNVDADGNNYSGSVVRFNSNSSYFEWAGGRVDDGADSIFLFEDIGGAECSIHDAIFTIQASLVGTGAVVKRTVTTVDSSACPRHFHHCFALAASWFADVNGFHAGYFDHIYSAGINIGANSLGNTLNNCRFAIPAAMTMTVSGNSTHVQMCEINSGALTVDANFAHGHFTNNVQDPAGTFTDSSVKTGTNQPIVEDPRNAIGRQVLVMATADLPAASASMNGHIVIEDAGAGDRNLIVYAGGQRFRIDGGANV